MLSKIVDYFKKSFHTHDWEIKEEHTNYGYENGSVRPSKMTKVYIQVCKKCGEIRTKEVRIF